MIIDFYNEAWVESQLSDDESFCGFVSVDTGRLQICDPSYQNYDNQIKERLGLTVDSSIGDGTFPVVSSHDGDRITIRFDLFISQALWYQGDFNEIEQLQIASSWLSDQTQSTRDDNKNDE